MFSRNIVYVYYRIAMWSELILGGDWVAYQIFLARGIDIGFLQVLMAAKNMYKNKPAKVSAEVLWNRLS